MLEAICNKIEAALPAIFTIAALVICLHGVARADTLADMERGVAQDMADARAMHSESSAIPPNPYAGAYQPPIETTLQNQEFINQSYRKD